jgi:hemerythrin superfamily protein
MDDLQRANDEAHTLIEAHYLEALEAVLDHRVDDARQAFSEFDTVVTAHLREEQEHLMPRLSAFEDSVARALGSGGFAGRRRLQRRLARTRHILARLSADSPRLAEDVLDALEMMWLVRRALHDHRTRERQVLYPRLAARLPAEERSAAGERLTALCQLDTAAAAEATA